MVKPADGHPKVDMRPCAGSFGGTPNDEKIENQGGEKKTYR
jgi:hypothetical protein